MATIKSRWWAASSEPWQVLRTTIFACVQPSNTDAAHNGASSPEPSSASPMLYRASKSYSPEEKAGSLAVVATPAIADEPLKRLAGQCAASKEPDASVKLHPQSRLAKILGNRERKDVHDAQPDVRPAVVCDDKAPLNRTQQCINPTVVDESSIHVCGFIAFFVMRIMCKPTSNQTNVQRSTKHTLLTQYIWRATDFLTAEGYWKGGLSNPAVIRTIIYLMRMFAFPRENVDFETMKNAFAFFCVLGIKYNLDCSINCTLLCHRLRTANFVVLEKLAMQVVDYDMLVHRGDWVHCGNMLRRCIGVLPEKESREAVEKWLSTVELHPPPGIPLKRSSCVANENRADMLLEALRAPERAVCRGEQRIVQQWMQGVEEKFDVQLDEKETSSRLLQARPTWPSLFGATKSIWALSSWL